MLTQTQFHRIYRLSAWYDLILSAPFALVPGALGVLWLMDWAGRGLGLGPMAPLDPLGMLFANFFGAVVTLWAVLRLSEDRPALARWDAATRLAFSLAMANALWAGASPLIWPLLGAELCWGVLQLLPVRGRPFASP